LLQGSHSTDHMLLRQVLGVVVPVTLSPVLTLCAFLDARSINAHPITQLAYGHRLAEGDPMPDKGAQVLKDDISIINKILSQLLLQEATISVLHVGRITSLYSVTRLPGNVAFSAARAVVALWALNTA